MCNVIFHKPNLPCAVRHEYVLPGVLQGASRRAKVFSTQKRIPHEIYVNGMGLVQVYGF